MTKQLIATLNDTRLSAYRSEWAHAAGVEPTEVGDSAIATLYVWQVSLSSAWYETLAFTEAAVRNAVDMSLRRWNKGQAGTDDWLQSAGAPLRTLIRQAGEKASSRAEQASVKREPGHPRQGAATTLDDRVAQLDFGNLVHLFPADPPTQRQQRGSGFTGRENLWIYGLHNAFPKLDASLMTGWSQQLPSGLPQEVENGYAVGAALDRLRRLRNRIGHHEQTFRVNHARRLKDASILLRAISPGAAVDLKNLDRVRRVLAMRPHP